ncbi:MAG: hypothetical protein HC869_04295 [Rhodospirillales bacterium]|nr:hypothetical protein [Rhodospirillales bacterium]
MLSLLGGAVPTDCDVDGPDPEVVQICSASSAIRYSFSTSRTDSSARLFIAGPPSQNENVMVQRRPASRRLRSQSPISFGGQLAELRFTWDATPHPAIRWTNEISIGDGPWQLIEEYLITSAG